VIRSKNEQGRTNNVFKTIKKGIFTGLNRKALPKTIRAQQSSVRETRPTKVLEEARKVMGLPSATLALITIFIQSNHFCFIESMVESEFSSRPEGPSAEQREFLLQELNGAHLRLSVNVVGGHISYLKNAHFYII